MHNDYMPTPTFDSVIKTHPYPVMTVDTSFRWKSLRPNKTSTPRVGVKPVRKRKK